MRSFVTIIMVETPDGFSDQFDDDIVVTATMDIPRSWLLWGPIKDRGRFVTHMTSDYLMGFRRAEDGTELTGRRLWALRRAYHDYMDLYERAHFVMAHEQ